MKFSLLKSFLSLFFLLHICACSPNGANENRVIIIQPLGNFSGPHAQAVLQEIRKINPNTILRKSIPLPASAYYKHRNRYRADSLLHYLKRYGNEDSVVIGLTEKDISTTKNNVTDWGVMGLGFNPGNACVVSTFRLAKINQKIQFYKVAVHELGHTQGLPHCPETTCFMRDAKGGNPLNDEKGFCKSCKTFLKSKGWQLN